MAILDLRPNCECCDRNLGPSDDAYICTYECTFCPACGEGVLAGVCPNCRGNLERRPIRPRAGPAGGLEKHPASTKRVLRPGGCAATTRGGGSVGDPGAARDRDGTRFRGMGGDPR